MFKLTIAVEGHEICLRECGVIVSVMYQQASCSVDWERGQDGQWALATLS